jgi:hypothetical protein
MDAHPLLRRLLSPAGFVLAGLCFLLPFVTVSCTNSKGAVSATYSGRILLTGGRAHLTSSLPADPDPAAQPSPPLNELAPDYSKPIAAQPLLVVALILAGLGVVASAVPRPWSRALAHGGVALIATLFLVGGEFIARRAAEFRVTTDAVGLVGADSPAAVPHTVTLEYGFWLALALLLLLAAGNTADLIRQSRLPAPLTTPPDPAVTPPDPAVAPPDLAAALPDPAEAPRPRP